MDTNTVLTWLGCIASLGGAGISLWQANQSQSAATESLRIKAQLVDRREASEFAQMQAACKKAQKSMEKYGHSSNLANLTGISTDKDASDVQEFIFYLREHRANFGANPSNDADQFCEMVTPLLDQFAMAKTATNMRKHGKLIVTHLSSFTAVIKKHLDSKNEA